MELQYYGANCVRITTKKASLVVDDNLADLGLKSVTKPTDIYLKTSPNIPTHKAQFSIDMPGEYEIAGITIHGTAARAHMDDKDKKGAIIYTVTVDDTKVAILGHIYPSLNEDQLEQIGFVDIAIVPVGNQGYTLDGKGALEVIKKIEPKIVIPTHYADKALKYQVPQVEMTEALKALGMESVEAVDKYKPQKSELTDTAHLVVLERQ